MERHILRSWKELSLFRKCETMAMHQAGKTSKEIAETTKTGLRTVQCCIKKLEGLWRRIVFEEEILAGKGPE